MIEATDSLVNPDWKEIDRTEALTPEGELKVDDASATGTRFFRVKLVKEGED